MEQDPEKELKEIIGELECSKGFKCYKSGFENLCKARDIGLETFIECLEEDPHDCPFSMRLHGVDYCKCPLRV
jgi:hypothetical protein